MKASRLAALAATALVAGCASDSNKTLHELRLDAYGQPAPVGETPAPTPASTLPKISGDIRLIDAVNLALAQNLPLRAAFLKREEAAGAITEAKAAAYPHAGLTGGVTSDLRERGDNADTYGVTWSITQPLWRSGAVSAGIRYAELYSASTDEAIRRQVQETVAQATEEFLGVLLAQQMVNVYTESAAVAERTLETAQKKRNAGSASDYEVLRAEVEVASTRAALIKAQTKTTLDDLFNKISEGQIKELNLIIKADVQGSVEAVTQSLEKLSNEEVRVRCIHGAVGAINESDTLLASTANAIIVGFNVRPDNNAREMAEREKIDIRLYRVIYQAIEEMEAAMKGMLAPKYKEVLLGHATVRQPFKVSGVGTIAGSYVTDGKIARNAQIRLLRDNIVIHEGKIDSLKRFKDDAKEVNSGYECGIGIENYNDVKEGDVIECFQMEEIEQ